MNSKHELHWLKIMISFIWIYMRIEKNANIAIFGKYRIIVNRKSKSNHILFEKWLMRENKYGTELVFQKIRLDRIHK